MSDQPGFFDVDERLEQLSEAGDPLERLLSVVGSGQGWPAAAP